jgi:hypothetical protein
MSSADLVQTNGLGLSFQAFTQVRMSASRALDAAVVAALEQVFGEVGEPAFHLIEPTGVGRGVVQGEAGVPCPASQALIAGVLWVP